MERYAPPSAPERSWLSKTSPFASGSPTSGAHRVARACESSRSRSPATSDVSAEVKAFILQRPGANVGGHASN